ncbi:DUF4974 domain-containing protein [Leptobacterium flavescens]|uniref:DUF4974 domain-containing protein n=1 Tax=Leptobacterium flavescens TaxID=472055 RepID=A0A6P0USN0_9FLAO|nr:FecR domain-containing protein [Leptobacterium flavescens]NER13873.1 DUF4974 domain-containing protein [Leptobacterium flavescens]
MEKNLIEKYIQGKANRQEKEVVYKWLKEDPLHQKEFSLLKAKYVAASLENVTDESVAEKYSSFNRKRQSAKNRFNYIVSAAASAVIIFLAWGLYQQSITEPENQLQNSLAVNYINISTENGQKKEVTLPDGSVVVLNIDSQLTYPDKFEDNIREITLNGEAFFDIAHNKEKPFIVNTNNIKVKVLGTSFNVKSYPTDKKVETTLVTGKVELLHEEESPIILEPSQKAVFHKKEKKVEIKEVKTSDVIAWREGKLIFNKTSIEQVILDLERKYNTKFIINSPKLLNYEYTGTFDNLTLDEVLKLLMISSPIEYEIKNDTIVLDMK